MFRKVLVSLVVTATLGAGTLAMTSAAEAHRRHHNGNVTIGLGFPFFGYGYPAYGYGYPGFGYPRYRHHYPLYYNDYDDYGDCGYRRVAIKKWNKAHTRRIVVHRKRWVCY